MKEKTTAMKFEPAMAKNMMSYACQPSQSKLDNPPTMQGPEEL